MPSYVKGETAEDGLFVNSLNISQLRKTLNSLKLFSRKFPLSEESGKHRQNVENEGNSFLHRAGEVFYGAGAVASIIWSLFISSIGLSNKKAPVSLSAAGSFFTLTIIGWLIFFGAGWTFRYLLNGNTSIGWRVRNQQDRQRRAMSMAANSILVVFLIMPATTGLVKYAMSPYEQPTAEPLGEAQKTEALEPHGGKDRFIPPDQLLLSELKGAFVSDPKSEITFNESFGAKYDSGPHPDFFDEEPIYFKITGLIKNNSNKSDLLVEIVIKILNCTEESKNNCEVVGEARSSQRLLVPSKQVRSFRRVVAFFELPKLRNWQWNYEITKVEALIE